MLAKSFKPKAVVYSDQPLSDDQIRKVAPSIYADAPHASRSGRYAYIPTSDVLTGLRKEGFQPFMVAQARTRVAGKEDFTKHLIRLRHASQIRAHEAQEIVLLNSHDGTSSYQMLAGVLRYVCCNGLVFGDASHDIRVPHKGDVGVRIIEGAYEILANFDRVSSSLAQLKSTLLSDHEQQIFARAALSLKYDEVENPAPVSEDALLRPRRREDRTSDIWTTFNRIQENLIQGGLSGRSTNGKRVTTRPVTGIDQNIKLNRALWTMADEMARLKAA